MMKISIDHQHELDLPKLTIITGPNGSGKTRFLKSFITNHTPILSEPLGEPLYYSFSTFSESSEKGIAAPTGTNLDPDFASLYRKERRAVIARSFENFRNKPNWDDPKGFYDFMESKYGENYANWFSPDERRYHESVVLLSQSLINASSLKPIRELLMSAEKSAKRPLLSLDSVSFERHRFGLPSVQLFETRFHDIFIQYQKSRLLFENDMIRTIYDCSDAERPLTFSKSEIKARFLEQYGAPPWEAFNAALSDLGLPYQIVPPSPDPNQSYGGNLIHNETGSYCGISSLSSGEQQLLSLALCAYHASNTQHRPFSFPKLVLLDEVDASLHPEMARRFIRIVMEVLCKQLDIHVIATTHSPSTVALAPEESLYLMHQARPKLQKVSRNLALTALLVGVPNLAFSYDGRRQVFTESQVDAETYTLAYDNLKSYMLSERSLSFVYATTKDTSGTDRNGGCSIVREIVRQLSDNATVFGLVDWDGHTDVHRNLSSGRFHVLAEGERDGLENVLYDPLVIAMICVREGSESDRRKLGFLKK